MHTSVISPVHCMVGHEEVGVMRYLVHLLLMFAWLAGIVIAKGFWSTFFALFLPLWAYYLVAERLAVRLL